MKRNIVTKYICFTENALNAATETLNQTPTQYRRLCLLTNKNEITHQIFENKTWPPMQPKNAGTIAVCEKACKNPG